VGDLGRNVQHDLLLPRLPLRQAGPRLHRSRRHPSAAEHLLNQERGLPQGLLQQVVGEHLEIDKHPVRCLVVEHRMLPPEVCQRGDRRCLLDLDRDRLDGIFSEVAILRDDRHDRFPHVPDPVVSQQRHRG